MRPVLSMIALVACGLVGGCSDEEGTTPEQSIRQSDTPDKGPQGSAEREPAVAANAMASPRDSIAHQLELLRAGKTEELRACFTQRHRDRITPEAVKEGQSEAKEYTLDELVDDVQMDEYEGQQTAKIKMKNGRTLTTVVLVDGKWLADTVWFR